MEKLICIHGHFYQPPRENPWLEAVELQDSAHPYHDWNERITAECYAPNAHARFLDGSGRIERIVNNYSRISFNFGPTLFSWLQEQAPDIYAAILAADKESQSRFSGHGSAIAQCYNHMIMPLANRRDKYTQALWGIRDFEARFGRQPEGMWLPECGVDTESLEVLAELGIKFTILSPFQARRVRPLAGGDWVDVTGARFDPSRMYQANLPSGRTIAIAFYDGPLSQAVAFEKLLINGERFAGRLMEGFDEKRDWDQLVHIATDGESYGHHHAYGDMALAYALNAVEKNTDVRLTIYGEYLERHPPQHEVELHEPSAWSCPHGVDRWKADCGCNSGGHGGWNQQWRGPLRTALDWLRDKVAGLYEAEAKQFLKDPWSARDEYIQIILNRDPANINEYFARHGTRAFTGPEQITALRLLEMQRHAMLMYTSCGWFFDELSGLETVQVIQYAARCLQLANDLAKEELEPPFLDLLKQAKSNLPEHGDGAQIYQKFVKPAIVTRETVAAHFAINSLFRQYEETSRIYSFTVHQEDRKNFTSGKARLAIGRIGVTFEITRNSDVITYGALHMGEHHIDCSVMPASDPESYAAMTKEVGDAFERADFPEVIRLLDRYFGPVHYSLKSVFRDEQRKVLDQILASTREDIHNTYRHITDRYAPLLRFLADLHAPTPRSLQLAMELILNTELRRQFEGEAADPEQVRHLFGELNTAKAPFEKEALGYAIKAHMDHLSDKLAKTPEDVNLLKQFSTTAQLLRELPLEVNLWKPQNLCNELHEQLLGTMRQRAAAGDETARNWTAEFQRLRENLGFHFEPEPAAA